MTVCQIKIEIDLYIDDDDEEPGALAKALASAMMDALEPREFKSKVSFTIGNSTMSWTEGDENVVVTIRKENDE